MTRYDAPLSVVLKGVVAGLAGTVASDLARRPAGLLGRGDRRAAPSGTDRLAAVLAERFASMTPPEV